ncbi:hypothetical protein [Ancylobacter pratisalsi]|uniref:Uncharacterized protein n=1 Tax=Ancylobacter pratisalsi TaxID=1745854 RepID=A0A6P1YUJ8_9HYPH|nr:hypothetical protein [Ancylobacter pratisalsi]QIB36521.1 hypothetical protein G3A50_22145 [Ancylobacter pratisalsi]
MTEAKMFRVVKFNAGFAVESPEGELMVAYKAKKAANDACRGYNIEAQNKNEERELRELAKQQEATARAARSKATVEQLKLF